MAKHVSREGGPVGGLVGVPVGGVVGKSVGDPVGGEVGVLWIVQWVEKWGLQEVDLNPYTGFVPSWLRMQLRVQIVLDNSSVLQGILY